MTKINDDGLNYASLQKQYDTGPSLAMCYRQGGTHAAYGWVKHIAGHYTPEQIAAYCEGYDAYGKPREECRQEGQADNGSKSKKEAQHD